MLPPLYGRGKVLKPEGIVDDGADEVAVMGLPSLDVLEGALELVPVALAMPDVTLPPVGR